MKYYACKWELRDELIEIEPAELARAVIQFYLNARANSDGFEALYSKLDNQSLIHAVQNNLNNCGYITNTTYEGTLQNILVPLLLKRLEE